MYKRIPIASTPFDGEAAVFTAVFFSVIFILIAAGRYFFTPPDERPQNFLWICSSLFGVPVIVCVMAMLYKISQL